MLTNEQIKFYKDNGYLIVSGVFQPVEVEECIRETDGMFSRVEKSGKNLEATWGGKCQDAKIPENDLGTTT